MIEKIPEFKRTSWIIFCACSLIFLLSLFFWILNFPGIRRSFVYKSSNSDVLKIENRFESIFPVSGKINNYIDELLTGPISEHCCPVFAKGTRLKNCYLRDSKLYVNLSADVLKADAYNTDFREQIDLLKKNIFNNFKNIKEIEVFFYGKLPFEYLNIYKNENLNS